MPPSNAVCLAPQIQNFRYLVIIIYFALENLQYISDL